MTKLLPLVAALAACGPAVDRQPTSDTRASSGAALSVEDDCIACHRAAPGVGGQDVDDYVFGNGTLALIDGGEWAAYGHGATSAYAQSGNPGAALVAAGGCLYCHAPQFPAVAGSWTSVHGDPSNPFRLANDNWNGRGKAGVCLVCHDPASTGYDPDQVGAEFPLANATTKVSATHFGMDHTALADGGRFCWDCHDAHGDFNYTVGNRALAYMFQERPVVSHGTTTTDGWGVPSPTGPVAPAVDFNKESGSSAAGFDWGDFVDSTATSGVYNGVCQVCHTSVGLSYFRQTLYTATHNAGVLCTSCHLHEQPPQGAFVPAAPVDTTPPAVTITDPAWGAYVRGTITVTANVSDDVGVVGGQLVYGWMTLNNLASQATLQGGVATFTLDTTSGAFVGRPDGGVAIEAQVFDAAGNIGKHRILVTVDNTPPVAAITSPAAGATVSGTVTVTAAVSDNLAGVTSADLLAGTAVVSSAVPAGGVATFALDTTALANGAAELRVVARDAAGNAGVSAPVQVTVANATSDTTPPAVTITDPTWGTYVRGTITVTAAVSDDVGVVSGQLMYGWMTLNNLASQATLQNGTATFTLDTTSGAFVGRPDGGVSIEAQAFDAAGNMGRHRILVNVDNTAPTVAITSPANGASVKSTVTVTATASDNLAGVAKVDFLVDGSPFGTDTAAPYSASLNAKPLARGLHTVTAVATDAAGNTASSSITVKR